MGEVGVGRPKLARCSVLLHSTWSRYYKEEPCSSACRTHPSIQVSSGPSMPKSSQEYQQRHVNFWVERTNSFAQPLHSGLSKTVKGSSQPLVEDCKVIAVSIPFSFHLNFLGPWIFKHQRDTGKLVPNALLWSHLPRGFLDALWTRNGSSQDTFLWVMLEILVWVSHIKWEALESLLLVTAFPVCAASFVN